MASPEEPAAPKANNGKTPSDKLNLKMILVSGRTGEFVFSHSDTAAVITQYVYDNWPADWSEEAKPETNILRLIYQGRFLHGNVSLGALKLPLGKTTVMHLVPRESLPEPNNHGNSRKDKGVPRPDNATTTQRHRVGCCAGCTIS